MKLKDMGIDQLEDCLSVILEELESRGLTDYTIPEGDFSPHRVEVVPKPNGFDKFQTAACGVLVGAAVYVATRL